MTTSQKKERKKCRLARRAAIELFREKAKFKEEIQILKVAAPKLLLF
jgi:hypothetical protein